MRTSLIALTALACTIQLAAAGDVTGKITLTGTPPAEKDITPLKEDANCGKFHPTMPKTRFYAVGEGGALADVIVSIQGISGKSTGASAAPLELDQKGCEYVPTILAAQTGQKLIIKNSDPVLHNVHTQPTADSGNKEMNTAQMAGSPDITITFDKPEPFLKFKCDVHPWMFAWVSVFDHPYFAVSGKDGTFKIANVPPGKYKIEASHRKAGSVVQEIEVKDGAATKVDFSIAAK